MTNKPNKVEEILKELIGQFILPNNRSTVNQCVIGNAENKGTVRIAGSAIPVFRAVKEALTSSYEQGVRDGERRIKEYAEDMRNKVDKGEYCKNEGERWANGYDCAMYDLLQALKNN